MVKCERELIISLQKYEYITFIKMIGFYLLSDAIRLNEIL